MDFADMGRFFLNREMMEGKMLARVNGTRIGKQLMGLILFLIVFGFSASAAQAVTLVFVHGKGDARDSIETRTNSYWTTNMISAATRNGQARSLVVTYDGRGYYWDAAVDIAAQINGYLNSYPSERLVFITHSFGGLVTRFMLCNATSSTPYYNYGGANFARINSATSHAITLAGPHLGSEVADLGSTLSNSLFTSWIVSLVDNNSNSAKVLTTSHLAYANQTYMRDSQRTKGFYTVAGTNTLNHIYHATDLGLAAIPLVVSFRTATDGLVATWSAHGIGAPGGDWYNTTANHDHNRHNDDPGYLGNIIGTYGW
jgi:triacylglycerol esterase/lipase EstA (alpha/beta hydrolase family)